MITDAAKAPTCTETGLTEGSHCSRCDHKVAQETVDALGHDMVTDAAVAPTCTATGLTEGSHCARCDHKVAQEEVAALGHEFDTLKAYCSVCYALNPDFIANTIVVGQENKLICNQYHLVGDLGPYEFLTVKIDEAGHYKFVGTGLAFTIYTIPTEAEGADFTTGTGASWAQYVFTEADLEPGTYWIGIVFLGGQGEYTVTVDKHVHSWSDATCTSAQKCECGKTQGTALGHDMVTDAAKAPTCTETGLTAGEHCTRCDHKVAQEVVPATGHDYVGGNCACGAKDPEYVDPTPDTPVDPEDPTDPDTPEQPEPELNLFQKILKMITDFFGKIVDFFKNIFIKK